MVVIAPSILAADFACLGDQVRETERAGAARIHIDVMDGHFVPNLSMGPEVVRSLRKVTSLPLEIHLMVDHPERFVDSFIDKGADILIVHREVLVDPWPLLRRIRDLGKKIGLAINPETQPEAVEPFLASLDVVLCMTVHPGYSGQAFLSESPQRIRQLRQMLDRYNPACDLEVDGGIDAATAHTVTAAGANVLVAATAIFAAAQGPAAGVRDLLAQALPKG